MENDSIEITTIDDEEYHLRKFLTWVEIDKLSTAGIRLFVDGKTIADGADIADLDSVEVEINTGERNLRRLAARLIGLNKGRIERLPRAHAIQLLAVVDRLEKEEDTALGELAPKAPIAKRLRESLETPSSSESQPTWEPSRPQSAP